MTTRISEPCRTELNFAADIRTIVTKEMKKRGTQPEKIAEALGIAIAGWENLLAREIWNLEAAIRIAEHLNISYTLRATRQKRDR